MIPQTELLNIYLMAFSIRNVELTISENYYKELVRCPVHLSIGQEMVPSIFSSLDNPKDLAVSTHRGHAHFLGKRGSIRRLFDEIHGLPTGCSGGNGGSMHLIDTDNGFMGSTAIVANTVPIGVGMSEAQNLLTNNNSITTIFMGEGATEEGVFYESLNYAKIRNLPCIFVIENNNFSVYTSLEPRQGKLNLEKKINGFCVNYIFVDNHNYMLLHNKWSHALDDVRNGKGPYVIEVMTHRYREHCGPNFDDHLNYRDETFLKKWKKLDILDLLKNDLIDSGIQESYLSKKEDQIFKFIKNEYKNSEINYLKKREKMNKTRV